jgi:hypothetical protein
MNAAHRIRKAQRLKFDKTERSIAIIAELIEKQCTSEALKDEKCTSITITNVFPTSDTLSPSDDLLIMHWISTNLSSVDRLCRRLRMEAEFGFDVEFTYKCSACNKPCGSDGLCSGYREEEGAKRWLSKKCTPDATAVFGALKVLWE